MARGRAAALAMAAVPEPEPAPAAAPGPPTRALAGKQDPQGCFPSSTRNHFPFRGLRRTSPAVTVNQIAHVDPRLALGFPLKSRGIPAEKPSQKIELAVELERAQVYSPPRPRPGIRERKNSQMRGEIPEEFVP